MSKFKVPPTHKGCKKIFSAIEERIEKIECFPRGSLVRLYMKTGQEIDVFPHEDKYSVAVWKGDNRTVVLEKVDDQYGLKRYLDT